MRASIRLSICDINFPGHHFVKPLLGASATWRRKLSTYRDGAVLKHSAVRHYLQQQRALVRSTGVRGRDATLDTIYALSSGSGKAAIAIVRLSGSLALNVYKALCPGKPDPQPRVATLRALFHPTSAQHVPAPLDPATLVLYFPGSQSSTGEDVIEFHIHGGPANISAVLRAIPQSVVKPKSPFLGALRYAEPGEFTRRALYSGRFSIPQVEALGHLLDAETEMQRQVAVDGLDHQMTNLYNSWQSDLLAARAQIEAYLDFSEDQHFEGSQHDVLAILVPAIKQLSCRLEAHVRNAARGELVRAGIKIGILGPPNAGKSSLINRIIGREAAIVSSEAGTTRDIIEVSVDLGGYLTIFGDSAGIRPKSSVGLVEAEGMRRSVVRASQSDIVVAVFGLPDNDDSIPGPGEADVLMTVAGLAKAGKQTLLVFNKSDLASGSENRKDLVAWEIPYVQRIMRAWSELVSSPDIQTPVLISCLEHQTKGHVGIEDFLDQLVQCMRMLTSPDEMDSISDPATPGALSRSSHERRRSLSASHRQQQLLRSCVFHLHEFIRAVDVRASTSGPNDEQTVDLVVAAETLRMASSCLAAMNGSNAMQDIDEILGVIFEKFCVGK